MRNVIQFDIPKAYVLNANQARRMHWAKKAKNAKAIRTLGYIAGREWAREHGTFDRQMRVIIWLSFADKRDRDPVNWADSGKPAIDGLVDAGVFTDDSSKYVIGPDYRLDETGKKGYLGMRIQFMEVE